MWGKKYMKKKNFSVLKTSTLRVMGLENISSIQTMISILTKNRSFLCNFCIVLLLSNLKSLNSLLNTNFRLPKQKSLQMTILNSVKMAESSPKWVENTVGSGEIACYEQFHLSSSTGQRPASYCHGLVSVVCTCLPPSLRQSVHVCVHP